VESKILQLWQETHSGTIAHPAKTTVMPVRQIAIKSIIFISVLVSPCYQMIFSPQWYNSNGYSNNPMFEEDNKMKGNEERILFAMGMMPL